MTAATAHLTAAGQRLGKQQHQQQGKKDSVEETVYDERHPLYNGDWKRSIPGINDDIAMDTFDEPHVKRKLAILEKHPEIKNFYGVEPRTIGVTCLLASLQLALSWVFGKALADYSIWPLVITAYFIGGTATQICGVIIHEVSHNLASESPLVNRLVGLTCNLTIPFPIAASFRRYHLDHHAFQGVEGKDPDLPLKWEIYLVKGNMFMKALFLFCYPLMYVVRGLAMQKTPSKWELINMAFTIVSDTLVVKYNGTRGLLYLFLSLWFGYGFHPAAMHFIQEHYTVTDGQETYSYYGGLNKWFLNIGYHNEHHDFTKVPWSKLPDVKNAAPEFYEPLAAHNSWVMVLVDFIINPQLGPQSRVGRSFEDHKNGRQMILEAKRKVTTDAAASEALGRADSALELQ